MREGDVPPPARSAEAFGGVLLGNFLTPETDTIGFEMLNLVLIII